MCSTNQLNNDKTFYDITYTQHALWLVKNILNICLYNDKKLIHLPIPWNGATQWKFPDFNLVQAFGLEKTKRTLLASKPTTKILFFTQDQIFYLKFSLTTWLLQFKPLLFLHSCSERTSELLFCNFPNCLPTRKSWHAFASRKLQPQLNWIFIQNLLKILWTDQNTCRDCKPLSHTLWFMNFSCVLPTSCAVY